MVWVSVMVEVVVVVVKMVVPMVVVMIVVVADGPPTTVVVVMAVAVLWSVVSKGHVRVLESLLLRFWSPLVKSR